MTDPRYDLKCNHHDCSLPNKLQTGYCDYHTAERWLKAGDKLMEWWNETDKLDRSRVDTDEIEYVADLLGVVLDEDKAHRVMDEPNQPEEDR